MVGTAPMHRSSRVFVMFSSLPLEAIICTHELEQNFGYFCVFKFRSSTLSPSIHWYAQHHTWHLIGDAALSSPLAKLLCAFLDAGTRRTSVRDRGRCFVPSSNSVTTVPHASSRTFWTRTSCTICDLDWLLCLPADSYASALARFRQR